MNIGADAPPAPANDLYSEGGQRATLDAQRANVLAQVEEYIVKNKIPPEYQPAYRSQVLSRLEQQVSAERTNENLAADSLLRRVLERGWTSIDQIRSDPESRGWFKQLNAQNQVHMNSVLQSNKVRDNKDVNFTTSPGYHQLFADVMNGKVTTATQLVARLGMGQVGLHYQPFFSAIIEQRKTGHDIIYRELEQQTNAIKGAWFANPMIPIKDGIPYQLEQWQQAVQRQITEANKLPQEAREKKLRELFDVNSPSYVGVGSSLENNYRPDRFSINQERGKFIQSGNALEPGKEGQDFDVARKKAFATAEITMLNRGQEKTQYEKLPVGAAYAVFDPGQNRWLVKQKN